MEAATSCIGDVQKTVGKLERLNNDDEISSTISDIHNKLRTADAACEEAMLIALENDNDPKLATAAQNIQAELANIRSQFHQSVLKARRRAHGDKRSKLLGVDNVATTGTSSSISPRLRNQSNSSTQGEDILMGTTADVTDALHRSLNNLRQELDRSVEVNVLLDHSTQTLGLAHQQHDSLTDILDKGSKLIKSLDNIYDQIIVIAAFLFFVAVCLYILKRRLWG